MTTGEPGQGRAVEPPTDGPPGVPPPGDPSDGGDGPAEGADPLRFADWMKRSATGAVLAGIARGLHQALEPPRHEVAYVMEADDPDEPDPPITLRFDPDDPTATVAVVRPHPPDPPAH